MQIHKEDEEEKEPTRLNNAGKERNVYTMKGLYRVVIVYTFLHLGEYACILTILVIENAKGRGGRGGGGGGIDDHIYYYP